LIGGIAGGLGFGWAGGVAGRAAGAAGRNAMGWVDKVNQWVLKRIRPWAIERVKTDREGTTLIRADGSRFIRWSDVQEIAVLKQPDPAIGCPIGCFALVIRAVGSTLAIVDETVAGYEELCQEILRRLEGVVPYEKWALELLASSQETGKVIFRRAAS
jgi:hypothetical protein